MISAPARLVNAPPILPQVQRLRVRSAPPAPCLSVVAESLKKQPCRYRSCAAIRFACPPLPGGHSPSLRRGILSRATAPAGTAGRRLSQGESAPSRLPSQSGTPPCAPDCPPRDERNRNEIFPRPPVSIADPAGEPIPSGGRSRTRIRGRRWRVHAR